MSTQPVILPVDRLDQLWPERLKNRRVGAVLHAASVTSRLDSTLAVLESLSSSGKTKLTALFGPQHGFETTTQDNMIEWTDYRHPRLDIPIHSLYGEHREPTDEMLEGVEVLFIDLMDIGARYYTFIWTMFLCMKASEKRGITVVVADRPNPINGVDIEGRPQEPNHLSFVGLHPLPIRHGKTIGELARHFQADCFPNVDLEVLPMENWNREQFYDETNLPWVMPSPNMPTIDTAIVYPGMCLFEGTNVSEGRGTTRPFELFGAPWIDGEALTDELNSLTLAGVRFRAASFEPGFQKYGGEVCRGAQFHITDRRDYQPVATALTILKLLKEKHPNDFGWKQPPYEYEFKKLPIEILCGRPEPVLFNETV